MTETDSASEATARGRAAALALDARLRDQEAEERVARLDETGPVPSEWGDPSLGAGIDSQRLRDELEALRQYRLAVERSRVWRLAQSLRRLVGRAW